MTGEDAVTWDLCGIVLSLMLVRQLLSFTTLFKTKSYLIYHNVFDFYPSGPVAVPANEGDTELTDISNNMVPSISRDSQETSQRSCGSKGSYSISPSTLQVCELEFVIETVTASLHEEIALILLYNTSYMMKINKGLIFHRPGIKPVILNTVIPHTYKSPPPPNWGGWHFWAWNFF